MRKMLLVVAGLALSGCGKKASEPNHDCASAVANAVNVSADEYKKNGVSDPTRDKIRDASVTRCNEDKWSNEVKKCLVDAKKTDDVSRCQQMMSKEQSDNMAKAITAAMASEASEQGSGASVPLEGSAGSAAEAGSGSAPAASPPIAGLPAACNDYKAMIEKLAACEKLPQASRDMLKKTFDDTSKAWANFEKLPDDAKTALENGCKQGSEALTKTAGAVCGF